jgi:O-antigen/teichoic acid export membrane protein
MSSTDAEPTDLRATARRGGRLGLASGLVEQLGSIVATVVLARLLSPRDFGLLAAANIVITLLVVFTQFGLGPSVVRRRSATPREVSTLFWAAVFLGLATGAIAALGSRAFAAAVGEPDAAPYLAVLGVPFLLRMTYGVPRGLLQRRLRFGALYATEVAAALVYTVAQIALAWLDAGAWAVVIAQILSGVIALILFITFSGFRPQLHFDKRVLREEASFSLGLLSTSALIWLSKNVDYWYVSRTEGAAALGLYFVAFVLPNILRQRLTWATTDVLFPVFRRVVDDRRRLLAAFEQAQRLHLYAGLPVMVGITVLATPIVRLFFGTRWLEAATPMRLLALAAAVDLTTVAPWLVLMATGNTKRNARTQGVRAVVLIIGLGFVFVDHRDLGMVALAVLLASTASALDAHRAMAKPLHATLKTGLSVMFVPVTACALMAGVVFAVDRFLIDWPAAPRLLVCVPVGVITYALGALAIRPAEARAMFREAMIFVAPRRGLRGQSPSEELGVAEAELPLVEDGALGLVERPPDEQGPT